jgi:hypothetical protein
MVKRIATPMTLGCCIDDAVRLWSSMSIVPHRSRASWLGRTAKVLMLILGIMSVPNMRLDALQHPHCTPHGAISLHRGHSSAASPTNPRGESRTWAPATDHECPHCPASECARIAPCASSTTTALSPAGFSLVSLHDHRTAVDPGHERASSINSPPDTPPPQVIA